jgi:hypothetical protein
MIYLHTKFQVPTSNGSLVIALKQKAKHRLHTAALLLLYIPHKKK